MNDRFAEAGPSVVNICQGRLRAESGGREYLHKGWQARTKSSVSCCDGCDGCDGFSHMY